MMINLDFEVNRRSHKLYVFCLYATISFQVNVRGNVRMVYITIKDYILYDQITAPPNFNQFLCSIESKSILYPTLYRGCLTY